VARIVGVETELITRRIGLHELNDAFDALRAGRGARSVLVLD
jgi:Zn-dependent alcohol dehydrogenase